MDTMIRAATVDDAEAILAIYAPVVRDTAISFETEPPDVDEIRRRITETLVRFPWLVCIRDDAVLGYAYGSPHRARAAYQWSVDVSVYVHQQARRAGGGRGLYAALLALLQRQGFYNAYAGITLPNPASVGLHESLGFRPLAVYRSVGYKLGVWHDVGWWHLALRPPAPGPAPPIPFARLEGLAEHVKDHSDQGLRRGPAGKG